QTSNRRAGASEEGKAADGIKIGHEAAHARTGIAGGSPLARRIRHFLLLDKWQILRPFAVVVTFVAGGRMHHLRQQLGVESFLLEISSVHRDPLVQPRKVRNHTDLCRRIHRGHCTILLSPGTNDPHAPTWSSNTQIGETCKSRSLTSQATYSRLRPVE